MNVSLTTAAITTDRTWLSNCGGSKSYSTQNLVESIRNFPTVLTMPGKNNRLGTTTQENILTFIFCFRTWTAARWPFKKSVQVWESKLPCGERTIRVQLNSTCPKQVSSLLWRTNTTATSKEKIVLFRSRIEICWKDSCNTTNIENQCRLVQRIYTSRREIEE